MLRFANSPRIAFLGPTASAPTSTATTQLDVLRKALAEFGLVEGRNIVIDSQWPDVDRLDRLPESAAALIALKPAVIIAIGATAARAAIAATTEVPIVFEVVVDPLANGLTSSLERPGGNVTGFTTFDPLHASRQLALLQEVIPGLTRVALLGDAGAAPGLYQTLEDAARDLGLVARILHSGARAASGLRRSPRSGQEGQRRRRCRPFHAGHHTASKTDRSSGGQAQPSHLVPQGSRRRGEPDVLWHVVRRSQPEGPQDTWTGFSKVRSLVISLWRPSGRPNSSSISGQREHSA